MEPKIRQRVPTARLDVIGSSEVYQPDQRLGPLGVASKSYEKRILRYLGNDPSKHGVVFYGKMGVEKYDVVSRATLGLPNPIGFTECCPGSVLELSACETAVVAMRQWGMCDTVVDGVTGFLCRDDREYVDRVVTLLANPEKAASMGTAGRRFATTKFTFGAICQRWANLFNEVLSSTIPEYPDVPIRGRYPRLGFRARNTRLKSSRLHALVRFVDRVHGVFLKRY